MKDYSTNFPTSIDDRHFFEDISLDKLPIMTKYQGMINASSFTAASEYINAMDVTFYGAWILNMLEERLIALENYLVYDVEKPNIVTYTDTEPTDVEVGYCWT